MTIHSFGYSSPASSEKVEAFDLFVENLALIRKHDKDILECADYFFCPLPFASCSWPYVGGDGPLCLGYLMLGWEDGILLEQCEHCGSDCLITSFAGSPLSGSNSWSGICGTCKLKQSSKRSKHERFSDKVIFVNALRKKYPQSLSHWVDYEGAEFSFGGTGLRPAGKKRLETLHLFNPTSLQVLLVELASSRIRPKNSPKLVS